MPLSSTSHLYVSPFSRRNCLTLMVAGGSSLLAAWGCYLLWQNKVVALGLLFAAILALVLGLSKWITPAVSMTISRRGLSYHHRRGTLRLCWQRCQRLDQVRHQGDDLAFIGIRLRQPERPLTGLTPRLALALFCEQRPLTILASGGQTNNAMLLVESSSHGGVLAAFSKQRRLLRQQLGYDLLLPHGSFDRSPDAMLELLKHHWQQAHGTAPSP
ncbi:DUF2982 domain-containing protein [Ferrimonas senticii]|uniref:DUF2982 domain-containing protein n=1 Tax=Ferrimonas senticii TaxID=394566 RepID=UPI00042214E5|nr:DUF2982 domain-containing protein [Ferrimonas senticii]